MPCGSRSGSRSSSCYRCSRSSRSSLTVAEEGNVGVLETFGRYSAEPLDPGLHLIAPWQSVEEVEIRAMAYYYGDSEADDVVKGGQSISAQTSEGSTITFDATIQLGPQRDRVVELLREVGDDWWSVIGQSAVRSCLRDATARVDLDVAITTGRDEIETGDLVDVAPNEVCVTRFPPEYLEWLYIQQLSSMESAIVVPPDFEDQIIIPSE